MTDKLTLADKDGPTEVATRVRSKLDTADFGSGYILNEVSNYNAAIYGRSNDVGTWGPIYPVNWSGIYTGETKALDVAYYENPFLDDPAAAIALHPNVAWPYVVVRYDAVDFPTIVEHKDKRITIASRLGSEGVDVNGTDQLVFDPAAFDQLTIYNQPDLTVPGYNPNEEHSLIAPGIKDQLTGDSTFNLGQDAAFALQKDLNIWGQNDSNTSTTDNQASEFTSEPWTLVQYLNLTTNVQIFL